MAQLKDHFDVAVVGAGMAGICCAAELIRNGADVVLIAETPEVAWNIRTKDVEGNIGWMQHPVWNGAWGGGWWYELARDLDVSVEFEFTPPINLILHGEGGPTQVHPLPFNSSAKGIVDTIDQMSPIPIDSMRDELLEIVRAGLKIEYRELQRMADLPLMKWLDDRGASDGIKLLLAALSGAWLFTTPENGADQISVFGLFGAIRIMQCAEAPVVTIVPDPWSGLALPLAAKIEELGGTILRGARVSEILIDDGRAHGVLLADGRRINADDIAIATGASRVGHIVPNPPAEIRAALDQAALTKLHEMDLFAVLNNPVITVDSYTMVMDYAMNFTLYLSPLHSLGPWSTKEGKQFIIVEAIQPQGEFEKRGGRDGVLKQIEQVLEELFPGYMDAVEARDVLFHRHTWQSSMTHGPKLPRQSKDIDKLWFVGDGSSPIVSIGIENASGAGIMGARDILQSHITSQT
jgi:phytoene dehydrogenase-like protein